MNVPDNNEGEERVIDPAMAIESLDDYIRRYGLPSGNGDGQAGGEFNGLTRLEATERVRAEEAYRDKVIKEHQAQQGTPPQEKDYDTPRLDEDGEGAVISVLLANKSTHTMPVQPLIAFCETARRMVTSRWRYGVRHGVADDSGMDATEPSANANATAPSQEAGGDEESPIMELSLVEFDAEAVVQFMHVLISLHDHQQKEKEVSSGARDKASRKRRMNDGTDETTNEQIMSLIDEGKISEQHIVECLKLAHFLQCTVILETLIPIVHLSIDSHNCMAICSLSDALNLKSLFEASVNYVIERLDVFQGTTSPGDSEGGTEQNRSSSSSNSDDDGEQEEIWASLPYELRSRVLTMRNVMRSSVIGRGSKVSGLFFSSGSEFLAIFRETIGDQKERLAYAKERHEEVIHERTEEWLIRCQRLTHQTWFDASSEAKKDFVYGHEVSYALGKIEKQSRRLETLESFYDEQKTIFKDGGFASEIRL